MAKDGEEESQSRCDSQEPARQFPGGREMVGEQLNGVFAHVRGNQGDAQSKDYEPAIVDAHRDSVNPRDQYLAFEKSCGVGGHLREGKKGFGVPPLGGDLSAKTTSA